MKKINPDDLAGIIARRDFDALLTLVQPYVAARRGRPVTVGKAKMTAEELQRYNRERKAAQRRRAEVKEGDEDMKLTELAGQRWQAMQDIDTARLTE